MFSRYNLAIASGAQVTPAQDIPDGQLLTGMFVDPSMTSTTATFNGAPESGGSGPYCTVSDGLGGSYTKTFAAGQYVPLDPPIFAGLASITVSLGSVETGPRNVILITTKG